MVHRAHVEDAGRAGKEQLRDAQPGGEAERARVVRRLEGPDAARKPIEQLEPVRLVAKEGLAQMRMALDEPGNDQLSGAIEDGGLGRSAEPRPDPRDPSLLDEEIGADDAPGRVHGHEGAAAEEHRAPERQHAPRT